MGTGGRRKKAREGPNADERFQLNHVLENGCSADR